MRGIKKRIRDNRYFNWILIVSNWCFQGILHADRTEKSYKFLFTIIFWIIIFCLIWDSANGSFFKTLLLSFFIAHSLNWIVNGNFYSLIVHRLLLVKQTKKKMFWYIDSFQQKIVSQEWVLYAAAFGSICKGTLKDSSDLDISIVRKPGFKNALLSILFLVLERKGADFKGIPLEIYISDTPDNSIKKFGGERNPVVIYDPQNIIDLYYYEKLSISDAWVINIGNEIEIK